MTRLYLAAIIILTANAAAWSQTMPLRGGRAPDGYISLSSNITISMPFDKSQDIEAQQKAAMESVYRMIKNSCELVVDAFAESCEITGVSSNVNMSNRNDREMSVTVSGQVQMVAKPRAVAAPNP
ncbi:hypothetical protein WHT83_09725 [Aminobacter sp. P9b]|uniref:hypothetical protein n=1 Tax=Aminobacter sp. P9b TaxID=3133697 RepID=UPI003253D39A